MKHRKIHIDLSPSPTARALLFVSGQKTVKTYCGKRARCTATTTDPTRSTCAVCWTRYMKEMESFTRFARTLSIKQGRTVR